MEAMQSLRRLFKTTSVTVWTLVLLSPLATGGDSLYSGRQRYAAFLPWQQQHQVQRQRCSLNCGYQLRDDRLSHLTRIQGIDRLHHARQGLPTTTSLFSGMSGNNGGSDDKDMNEGSSNNQTAVLVAAESPSSASATVVDKLKEMGTDLAKKASLDRRRIPPFQVEDFNLLFYDLFLIVNLSLSISFWVKHRMDFAFIGSAFDEGCLLGLCWIAAGLVRGAFLYSAVDNHNYGSKAGGGPGAAALLGFHTYTTAVIFRLVFALLIAYVEHRPVGVAPGEDLVPLEIACGLPLMSAWRALHSSNVPRI